MSNAGENIANAETQAGDIPAGEAAHMRATPDNIESIVDIGFGDDEIVQPAGKEISENPEDGEAVNGSDGQESEAEEAEGDEVEESEEEQESQEADADEDDGESEEESDDSESEEENAEEDDEFKDDMPKGLDPKAQKIFNKTFGKFRKKYQAVRDARDELQAKVVELESSVNAKQSEAVRIAAEKVIPIGSDMVLPDVQTMDDLAKVEADAWKSLEWAMAYENKPVLQDDEGREYVAKVTLKDGSEKLFSKEDIARIKFNADKTLRKTIPAKKDYLQRNESYNSRLVKYFPELKNPDSALSRRVNEVILRMPWVKNIPGYKQAVISFIAGQDLLVATQGNLFKTVETLKKPAAIKKEKKPIVPAARKPKGAVIPHKSAAGHESRKFAKPRATPENIENLIVI